MRKSNRSRIARAGRRERCRKIYTHEARGGGVVIIANVASLDRFQAQPIWEIPVDFSIERHDGDYQGNAVINYANLEVPYTRISEHKHFAPWEQHDKTLIYKEYSRLCGQVDTPYYPIRLAKDKTQLARYVAIANKEHGVTFVGRLGTYRYLDMHVTIEEALNVAEKYLSMGRNTTAMPAFCVSPN